MKQQLKDSRPGLRSGWGYSDRGELTQVKQQLAGAMGMTLNRYEKFIKRNRQYRRRVKTYGRNRLNMAGDGPAPYKPRRVPSG